MLREAQQPGTAGGHGLTRGSVPGLVSGTPKPEFGWSFQLLSSKEKGAGTALLTHLAGEHLEEQPQGRERHGVTEQADRDASPLRLKNRLKRLFTNSSHSFFSGTMLIMQI